MDSVHVYDAAYEGIPRWDIPRPQPVIVDLVENNRVTGPVLDLGCGTGENAMFMAERGLSVTAIDFSDRALEKARRKTEDRGLHVDYRSLDALNLHKLTEETGGASSFRTAIDSCLFHVLSDTDRSVYVRNLAHVMESGSELFLLCFSDLEPKTWGPRRIAVREIVGSFARGWSIVSIDASRVEHRKLIRIRDTGAVDPAPATTSARAWLAHMVRR